MSATVLQYSSPAAASRRNSRSVLAGRIITGIALAFMIFDVGVKLSGAAQAMEGTSQLGFPVSAVIPLGLVEMVCLLLYMIPRTAPLGATLLTAYLGGAVAIHVQLGNPVFTHMLSPVYVAIFLWGGLFLRDPRVRAALGKVPPRGVR